jgi:hypothetical protein
MRGAGRRRTAGESMVDGRAAGASWHTAKKGTPSVSGSNTDDTRPEPTAQRRRPGRRLFTSSSTGRGLAAAAPAPRRPPRRRRGSSPPAASHVQLAPRTGGPSSAYGQRLDCRLDCRRRGVAPTRDQSRSSPTASLQWSQRSAATCASLRLLQHSRQRHPVPLVDLDLLMEDCPYSTVGHPARRTAAFFLAWHSLLCASRACLASKSFSYL